MAAHSTPRAVLFDALGTLISFEPPAPRLRLALRERLGVDVGAEAARAAIGAEIAYYRAHLHEGRDAASLADLRRRCAAAMQPVLGPLPLDVLTEALLDALRFFAYPDSAPALAALRAAGIRIVVVSNWDASLHERLRETGLAELVDGALASAEVGVAKPDSAIFTAALALAGVGPEEAWHVGDTPAADIDGARAAGLRAILIARDEPPGKTGFALRPRKLGPRATLDGDTTVVRSLAELLPLALPR